MSLYVLTVCTYNRTRSVLMGALVGHHMARLDIDGYIATAGVEGPAGKHATNQVVRLLAQRGIDVSEHRSSMLDAQVVSEADLILCAEVRHVTHIAAKWPDAFARTFTLPELVDRSLPIGGAGEGGFDRWVARLNEGRPRGVHYLSDPYIAEVDDPTGQVGRVWEDSFTQIDRLCHRTARLIR